MAKTTQKTGKTTAATKTATRSKTAAKPAPKTAAKPTRSTPVAASKTKRPLVDKTPPAKKAEPKKVSRVVPAKTAATPAPKTAAKPPAKSAGHATATPASPAPRSVAAPAPPPSKPSKPTVTDTKSSSSSAKPTASKARAVAAPSAGTDGVTMQDGRYALPTTTRIDLPKGYKPSAKEEYMSPMHLEFFRRKLQTWREDLVEESKQTIENLRDEVRDVGDEAERATRETENSLELRTRDRYRKLIAKIDKALKRIEEGRYGYCEETDEEIGIDRLEARPIATLCLDAQERWEHRQKQMGD